MTDILLLNYTGEVRRFNQFAVGLFRKIDVSAAKISTLFVPGVDFVLKKLNRRRVGLGRFEAAGIVIFGGVDEVADGVGG